MDRPAVLSEVFAGAPLGVQVGALKSDGDCRSGDMFLDAVLDRGAVSGGLPVHPDVPVDRPEGVRDTDRTVGAVHAVVPVGGLRACNTSDLSGTGVQVDLFDQHLVDAEPAVGRKEEPTVVTPCRPERPGRDSRDSRGFIVEYVGSGFRCDPLREVDSPGADRVVIPIDAQLAVCRDAHHVGAFTVTEIGLDRGNV